MFFKSIVIIGLVLVSKWIGLICTLIYLLHGIRDLELFYSLIFILLKEDLVVINKETKKINYQKSD